MPKVFELAKELDIGALVLVEKLKGLGLNVRNHMSTLSDEDVGKVLKSFSREQKVEEEKKKKAKKKTTKKKASKKKVAVRKVVKKKVDGRILGPDQGTELQQQEASKEDQGKVLEQQPLSEETGTVESGEEIKATGAATSKGKGGSRKVVRKKASEIAEEKAQKAKERKEEARKKESQESQPFQERPIQRGFQVVFDPTLGESQKAKSQESETKLSPSPARSPEASSPPAKQDKPHRSGNSGEEEGGGDQSKKRMGALSQMMAKGKGVRRDLTQLRADEEMKSYGVIIGKVNYTPVGRKKVHLGPSEKTMQLETKEEKRYINVQGVVTGAELAKKLKIKFKEFAVKVLKLNLLIKSSDYLGVGLAGELAALYNYRVKDTSFKEEVLIGVDDSSEKKVSLKVDENLCPRSPVVTIMGHVDHGKTTLLDSIRKAKVVESEAGGITQHVGAYQVAVGEQKITFLDTPGHAAFAAMRQRGANVTDIVVLVVAADDGVMPQTKESIRFCQQADVPIIVAVNKMDKEGANPDRIQQELIEFGLTPEDWGGETQYVKISALKGEGLDDLLETIKLLAEIMELQGDPRGRAEGVVIESRVAAGRGPMTTVLVQKGTLSRGDYLVVGETFGRGRSLMNYDGQPLLSAGPGVPVQILGLHDASNPGDTINVVKNEREAKKIVDNRIDERKQLANVKAKPKLSLEDFFASVSEEEEGKKSLKLIIRADVQGSFEAIKNGLEGLGNDEVAVEIIGGGVGAITDNDVMMASSSVGYIIGFNMRPVTSARRLAEEQRVDIKTYSIIYELLDDVRAALEGLLAPEQIETYIGRATIKETFVIPKQGTIAGSSVIDGKIKKGCHIRLLRDGKIVFDGKLSSLRRFKEDVKEVANGLECGIGLEGFNDVKQNDVFEAYLLEERDRKLEVSEVAV